MRENCSSSIIRAACFDIVESSDVWEGQNRDGSNGSLQCIEYYLLAHRLYLSAIATIEVKERLYNRQKPISELPVEAQKGLQFGMNS